MEHLMLPAGVELTEQETIPCMCSDDYIGINFLDYPSRANPSYKIPQDGTAAWLQAVPSPLGLPAFQRFLQTWLFFGLLQEVLSTSFRHKDFVRYIADGSTSKSVLSTAKLRELMDAWTERATHDQGFDHDRAKHLRKCFQVTYTALSAAQADFDADLKFTIAAVAETLMAIVKGACELKQMDDIFSKAIAWMIFDDPQARIKRFHRSGWCRAQAARALRHHQACQSAHFLSHLGKNQIEKGHGGCQPEKCKASQIDQTDQTDQTDQKDQKYSPPHFPADCTCQDITMEQDVLLQMLQLGKTVIVLLDIRYDEVSGEMLVSPIPSKPDSFYVALSHVWVDGLGNARSNALPRCQLRRISNLLTQFERETISNSEQRRPYLWLDTLCCPTERKAKQLALERMPQTYREATHVLVLESSVVDISHSSLQPVEILARICTSAWMYRVWTLQEAFLAQKLWVQFYDGVVELGQLAEELKAKMWPTASINMVKPLIHKADELRFVPDESDAGDLFNLATALKHRDLSVESDEPLCIAAFLRLDVGIIAEEPIGRMERMWSSIDRTRKMISRDVIFYTGPRLATPGYRWAPRTMLHIENQAPFFLSNETPGAAITEQGLLLSCTAFPVSVAARVDGILTRSTLAALDTMDFLRDETNRWYKATSNAEQRKHATDLGREKTSAVGWGSMYEILAVGDSAFEVLTQHAPEQEKSRLACLLVLVTRARSQRPKHVHACRQFTLERLDPTTSGMLNSIFCQAEAMQHAEITREIIRTAKEGPQSPAYRAAMSRFMAEVNLFLDHFMEDSYVKVPNTHLGLNEYPRKALFALLSRFYRNRHLMMGKVFKEAQSYCVD